MTQNNTQPLQTTLDHARKLAASGQATTITPSLGRAGPPRR